MGFLVGVSLSMQVLAETNEAPSVPTDGEADIQIRYGKEETSYEYRINGELVEIKVVPKVGPVYYLVPSDSGTWERSEHSRMLLPSWKILEW